MKTLSTLMIIAGFGALTALHLTEQQRHQRELNELRDDVAAVSNAAETRHRQAVAAALSTAAALSSTAMASPAPPQAAAPIEKDEVSPGEATGDAVPAPAPGQPRQDRAEQVRNLLETSFQSQSVDPFWSRDAERTARDKLAKTLRDPSELRGIECRASLCRIETEHEGREQYDQFVQKTFFDPEQSPWNGAFFATRVPSEDGRVHTLHFLAREGTELPAFPEQRPEAPAR